MTAAIAYCRAGFEREAGADLAQLAKNMGTEIAVDASVGSGFVLAVFDAFEAKRWSRAIEHSPPIFIRALFLGSGPHALFDGGQSRGRPDRLTPLLALIERSTTESPLNRDSNLHASYDSIRLETPDTNEGKALSGLTRALVSRMSQALIERGLLDPDRRASTESTFGLRSGRSGVGAKIAFDPAPTHLHILFTSGAQVYVGASVSPWASRWPMGIPRLRMPGGAPSRSTLKLAEAFFTFLGEQESSVLSAGMRAVDLGAAPGGWTWQLVHRGIRVIAVDNGPMKGSLRDDPLVTHLRVDGLTYVPKRPVDWMVCDIVEQPARIATLVARWIAEGHAQHVIFNLKLPMKKRYDEVRRCEAIIRNAVGKSRSTCRLHLRQLYHDRAEVTGYIGPNLR